MKRTHARSGRSRNHDVENCLCDRPVCRGGGFGAAWRRVYAESANTDYKQGQAAEAREDYDTAFNDFQKALKRIPRMRAPRLRWRGCG